MVFGRLMFCIYICVEIQPYGITVKPQFMNTKVLEQILRIVAMVASAIAGYLSHDSVSVLF